MRNADRLLADTRGMSVLVEVNSLFLAADRQEAEALLDTLMEAELAVICPSDPERLTICSNCNGELVNPADESLEEDNAAWAQGAPCAVCADSEYPGQEMPCAREHTAGATFYSDARWLTSEDRRTAALLRELLAMLETNDVAVVHSFIAARLEDIEFAR